MRAERNVTLKYHVREKKKKWYYLTHAHLSKPLKGFLYQQITDGKNVVLRGASC